MKRKTKSINVPEGLHRDLRIEASVQGKTVGAHCVAVLEKHGVRRMAKGKAAS